MYRFQTFTKAAIAVGLLIGTAIAGAPALASSDPTKGCEGLSAAIRSELKAPYKPVGSRLSKSCISDARVRATPETLHLFVASAFYHENVATRKLALRKLREYQCTNKVDCTELSKLVDTHTKANSASKAKAWKQVRLEATALRDEARTRAADAR